MEKTTICSTKRLNLGEILQSLQDAEKLRDLLTKTEDWLYDEGEDVEKKVYDARMCELKKLGDPVQERHREYENRKNAFDDFDRAIMVICLIYWAYRIVGRRENFRI